MSLGDAAETLRIVYAVDVADHGTKKLLASERAVQKSLKQTTSSFAQQDAQARRSATTATQVAARRSAGFAREATAARGTADALRAVGRQEALLKSLGPGAAAAQARLTTEHNRQTAALKRLTLAEKAQATALRARARLAERMPAAAGAGRGAAGAGARPLVTSAAGGLGARAASPALAGTVGIGVALAQTIQFDKAMRNVNSIAQLNEKQFQQLGKSVRGLAGDTAQAPKTLAEGLYDLVSSGFNAKQSLSILRQSAKAATAGLTDTATSTKAVAAVLNAYRLPASAAANVSDTLFQTVNKGVISFEQLSSTIGDVLPFASSLGVGLDQVGASVSTLTKAGISPEETMTRIKNVMVTMLKPGDALSATFKKLGVNSGESLIKQKGFQGAIEAIAGSTNGTKAALAKLFPNIRSLGGALALTGRNANGARSDLASFGNVTGATNKALAEQSKSVSFQWNKLKAQSSALAISVGSKLVPALNGVVGAMGKISGGKGKVGGALSDFFRGVGGAKGGRPRGHLTDRQTRADERLRAARGDREAAASLRLQRATGRTIRQRLPDKPVTGAQRAGSAVRDVLGKVGDQAKKLGPILLSAGRQLIDAFKPAMPFLRNVLLPLLEGVGKGVIGGIVVAFKIAVPIIKVVASVFGFVGKALRPLRGVFKGIGTVIGFLLGGPILGLLGKIPKVGGVFRLLGAPIRFVIGILGKIGGVFGKLPGFAGRAVGRVVSFVGGLPGKIGGLVGGIAKGFVRIGGKIISGIVSGIKAAPKAIVNALVSIIPKPLRTVLGKVGGAISDALGFRRGGRVRRYASGGLVPIVASGGEMLVHNGAASMIPGPSDRDGTPMLAPAGAAILTGSGQEMMAGGASLNEAIAGQLPHFAKGGVTGPAGRLIFGHFRSNRFSDNQSAGWVGNFQQESGLDPGAVQPGGPGRGLAQWGGGRFTNLQRFAASRRKRWSDMGTQLDFVLRELAGPERSAGQAIRAAKSLPAAVTAIVRKYERAGIVGNRFGPAQAALKAFGGGRGGGGAATGGGGTSSGGQSSSGPLGRNRLRSGLIADAFSQGQQAGQEGLTRGDIRRGGNPILAAIKEAGASAAGSSAAPSGARGRPSARPSAGAIAAGGGWGGSENIIRAAIKGLGSASFKRAANHPLSIKNPSSDHNMANKGAFAADLPPGDGIFNTLRKRLKIPAQKGSWNNFPNRPVKGYRSQLLWHAPDGSHKDHVHVGAKKLRRGGFVSTGSTPSSTGGTPIGGALSGGLRKALSMAGGSLEALDKTIGRSLQGKLDTLRAQLERRVRKGGPRKTIERLQAVLSLIDFEVGRRIGRIQAAVERRTAGIERGRGVVDRHLRKYGVSGDGVQGNAVMQSVQAQETSVRRQNVAGLQSALQRAKRSKNKTAIREITGQLQEAIADLDESITRQVELWRDGLRAVGQEAVDRAGFGASWMQGNMAGLDASQRLSRTQDTAQGMRDRSSWISGGVAPALQQQVAAAQFNAQMQAAAGDLNGWRQAVLDAQSAATDLANAQADAIDLIREAAAREAQDRVDTAVFGSTMADLGLRRLEVEQQLAGTASSTGGAQARADYIRQQIIPALDAQIIALTAQQMEAQRQGNTDLVRQLQEQIFGAQTQILQDNLDANQQTAENTDALKEFGGSVAFSYHGEQQVDVIGSRIGA